MSTESVIKEIRRFLESDEPEVLCIKGKWGVGKTFVWRRLLGEAQEAGTLKLRSYSYVSLFGLNSLDDLRYAVWESTVTSDRVLSGPDVSTIQSLLAKGVNAGRRSGSMITPVLGFLGLRDGGEALMRSAFVLVRKQLICLDDLERAGAGLSERDVLGLVSFLKEQRNCKVVLLLNDERMGEAGRQEFERLLEKVVDVSVVFGPSAEEAAAIAIIDDKPIGQRLRRASGTLGITNIRVIKKIERLALRLAELLKAFSPEILDQAVTTCTLGGWAIFEPDSAPSISFIRQFNSIAIGLRDRDTQVEEVVRWRDRLTALPYAASDDFDLAILDGISAGYFNEEMLLAQAKALEERNKRSGRDDSFSQAWDRYHGSLAVNDDEILDLLFQGARENLKNISPLNINGTVRLFREYGRSDDADALIADYVAAQPDDPAFFDIRNHHFSADDALDPALEQAFNTRRNGFIDNRDPAVVLLDLANDHGWSEDDELLLSKVSSTDFERIFETIEGRILRRLVQTVLVLSGRPSPEASAIGLSAKAALSRIAEKSPLRARRLQAWGFDAESWRAAARAIGVEEEK